MWQPGFGSQEHHDEDAYERFGEKFADAQYEILEVKNLKFEHYLRTAVLNHGIIIGNSCPIRISRPGSLRISRTTINQSFFSWLKHSSLWRE
jgi:hypothetical protein